MPAALETRPARVIAPKLADPNRARLLAIVARQARRAVVFRCRPTRKTRLFVWNLRDDMLEGRQWFFGRIYERRCDLSLDGKLLSYFAAKFVKPYGTWTAISRPPYFAALAKLQTRRKHCQSSGGSGRRAPAGAT
jgi:hypothetical protein